MKEQEPNVIVAELNSRPPNISLNIKEEEPWRYILLFPPASLCPARVIARYIYTGSQKKQKKAKVKKASVV